MSFTYPEGPVVTPEQEGAAADGVVFTDGAIQQGSSTFTSSTLTRASMGQTIYIMGAGASTSLGTTTGSSPLPNPTTSIPVTALSQAIPPGLVVVTSGSHAQVFRTSGVSSGATSIPVDSETPNATYNPGSSVRLYGAGFTTTISSVSGTTATLAGSASSTVTGTQGWFGTDDTAAIQAAITAVDAAGGGRILFDAKNYIVAGSLSTSGSGNSQLVIPSHLSGTLPWIYLEGVQGSTALCSTFVTGTYSGTHGPPSMLGGGTVEGLGASFSDAVRIEGINILLPENPTLGALDFSTCLSDIVRFVGVHCPNPGGGYGLAGRQPSSTWAFGLLNSLGSDGHVEVDQYSSTGMYVGLLGGDHLQVGYSLTLQNFIGFGFYDGHSPYPTDAQMLDIEGCTYGIAGWTPSGGVQSLSSGSGSQNGLRGNLNFEDWGSWEAPIPPQGAHVLDANSNIIGKVTFHRRSLVGGYALGPLNVTGGARLLLHGLGSDSDGPVAKGFIQVFTSNGTWTKPPGVSVVEVYCIAGGSGGASGPVTASGTASAGGAGGGAGGYSEGTFAASDLTATVAVTVGGVSTGGTGVTSGSGNQPKAGGNTSFGSYLAAQGASGAAAAGTGSTQSGAPATAGTSGSSGQNGVGGMAGAGGAGGGITTAPAFKAGGGGGVGGGFANSGGTQGSTDSAAGAAGTASTATNSPVGGGGGGGGASSITTNGGAGGNGGAYGSGGGGGGAALSGHTSGAGGNGAAGVCVVISR